MSIQRQAREEKQKKEEPAIPAPAEDGIVGGPTPPPQPPKL